MILLTSSVAPVAKHLNENFLKDKEYKSILFIDTAAENYPEDGEWLIADLNSLKEQGYEVDRYSLTNHTRDEIEQKIDQYDIVCMCGGNTFYLLQQMQKTKSLDLIRDFVLSGKPYIGTSAGSIITALDIAPTEKIDSKDEAPELNGTLGLGLVDFIALPHWGSESFRKVYLSDRIERVYNDINHKYVLLNDNQYIHVNKDGYIKIIDVAH